MTTAEDHHNPAHEAHVNPAELASSIANLHKQEVDKYDQIAMGEPISMPLEIDGQVVEVSPRELELEPIAEDPSRLMAFIMGHKKEVKILGPVTLAAVLAGVAAMGYVKKKKQ